MKPHNSVPELRMRLMILPFLLASGPPPRSARYTASRPLHSLLVGTATLSRCPAKVLQDLGESDHDQDDRPHPRKSVHVGEQVIQQEQHAKRDQQQRAEHQTAFSLSWKRFSNQMPSAISRIGQSRT